MGQFLEELPEYLIEWILKQQMFWVASAPLSADGHVNISPKAIEGTFHVVNSRRVWYEDLSGTGAETVAHIRENGRITILFHAFEGPARIVRLYGKGFFYELGSPEYEALVKSERRLPGSRSVIGLDVLKVGTTCGYAVPYYQFISHRTQLLDWAAKKEAVDQEDAIAPSGSLTRTLDSVDNQSHINPKGMKHWWQSHNLSSLDGLPAFSHNFGLGFPFVFSFGRLRASRGPTAPPSKGSSFRNTLVPLPTSPNSTVLLLSHPNQAAWRKSFGRYHRESTVSLLFNLLPYLLTFAIGIFLGRVYDHHHHIYIVSKFTDRL